MYYLNPELLLYFIVHKKQELLYFMFLNLILERPFTDIQGRITPETDCFACVISSHGMEGQAKVRGHGTREPYVRTEHFIHTKDGVVRTTELLELFNDRYCRNLRGKPRMFFIQVL